MKKHYFLIFLSIALIALITSACKKDEAEKALQITYDGKTYELNKGCISKPTITKKALAVGYGYGIYLMSSGITMLYDAPPTGTGNFFGIWLYSSSETELVPGTYQYSDSGEAFTFDDGLIFLETSYEPLKSLSPTYFTGGTLKVGVSGDTYEFTFDGTLEGGKTISTYYKGTLTQIYDAPEK